MEEHCECWLWDFTFENAQGKGWDSLSDADFSHTFKNSQSTVRESPV